MRVVIQRVFESGIFAVRDVVRTVVRCGVLCGMLCDGVGFGSFEPPDSLELFILASSPSNSSTKSNAQKQVADKHK